MFLKKNRPSPMKFRPKFRPNNFYPKFDLKFSPKFSPKFLPDKIFKFCIKKLLFKKTVYLLIEEFAIGTKRVELEFEINFSLVFEAFSCRLMSRT